MFFTRKTKNTSKIKKEASFKITNVLQSKSSAAKLTHISTVREKTMRFTINENGKIDTFSLIIIRN